jgi:hypothetical protein
MLDICDSWMSAQHYRLERVQAGLSVCCGVIRPTCRYSGLEVSSSVAKGQTIGRRRNDRRGLVYGISFLTDPYSLEQQARKLDVTTQLLP